MYIIRKAFKKIKHIKKFSTVKVVSKTTNIKMVTATDNYPRIREYFRNKTILITGASGFLGKLLLEKLLRSCPDVKEIYILLRPKRNMSTKERFQKIISSVVSLIDNKAFYDI